MMQFAIIGIGAGAAAALLFASVTSGSWLSIPLFYLAPLPIMIAGLGWSHWAALTAALTGAWPRARVRHRVPVRVPRRRRFPGLVAWLSRHARPPGGRSTATSGRTRMVSARAPGGVGGDPRRAGRDRRHSQFRHRCAKASAPASTTRLPECCECRPAHRPTRR